MKNKLSKFFFGFALVLFGLAIGAGVNYLDMRQFETRLDGFMSRPASEVSGILRSLKSEYEFSKKNISPELSVALLRDFSAIDLNAKSSLQDILQSVSKKKSDALHHMSAFLFLASLSLMNYVVLRKSEKKQSNLVRATI